MSAPFDWNVTSIPRDPVPVDAIPDIGENQQIVYTEWMGRSPQDIEDQISYPLTVSLLGIPGVKTIRSYSNFGFSSIYIIFKDEVEFYATPANNVKLQDVFNSVNMSNVDVGARTIEINKAEYVIRGLGFIKDIEDIENSVITENNKNVPIRIKDAP